MMAKPLQYAGQFVFLAALMAVIGYFSTKPSYHRVPDGMAQIKLSLAHGGARKVDCRRLTSKEIAALPANERRPNTCSRERIAVRVQLSLDGEIIYDELLSATGLTNDGPARAYTKLLVPAGEHNVVVRMRDSKRTEGFDYETRRRFVLQPYQNLAIDFRADAGGFIFR
jgi:hypothetical protein